MPLGHFKFTQYTPEYSLSTDENKESHRLHDGVNNVFHPQKRKWKLNAA